MTKNLFEGYCTDLPFDKGARVRVNRGARLVSSHPRKDGWYKAQRSQVVTIHHIMPGQSYTDLTISERDMDRLVTKGHGEKIAELKRLREASDHKALKEFRIHTLNPRIVWVGTGGYWVEADINDVEAIEDETP